MDPSIEKPATAGAKERKRSIWFHLHFWLGWTAAVPIALVCLTGGLLVFEQDLFRWEHSEFFNLEQTGTPLSIEQVLSRYQSANPPLRVNHLGIPRSPRHAYSAYCVEIRPEGSRGVRVFLNPYNGELTRMNAGFSMSETLIALHRRLAAGRTGQLIVGTSSAVLAITCIVGLVLWWPLRGRTFARAWRRGQALDWHNALGLVALVPLIVMAVTGVSFTWGRNIFPLLDKLQGQPSLPQRPVATAPEGMDKIPIGDVLARVEALIPESRMTGIQPSNSKNAAHAFFFDTDAGNLQLFMDPYTGEELARFDGSGKGPVGWYRKQFARFHTMGPFPFFIQVFWGLLSIGGTVLVVTGMWVSVKRWRRPKRRIARSSAEGVAPG